ncbi:MAG: hypothetical protein LKM30_05715 [Bacilli bacterium]|jgi:formate-dependent nitrite reductase membrane component NrfD|nr:hypothetical protein [Bacilli bacterium]
MENENKISSEKNSLAFEQAREDSSIQSTSLSEIADSDEATLSDALKQNPVKLFFLRNAIKVKNHVAIIPMILTIVTLIILYLGIHEIAYAVSSKLTLDSYNSFFFFVNLVDAIVIVLLYLIIANKKTSTKKRIVMSVLFYLAVAGSLAIDFFFISDAKVESEMFNSLNQYKDKEGYVVKALGYIRLHLVFLFITLGTAIVAPIVQPFTKKIHLSHSKKAHD